LRFVWLTSAAPDFGHARAANTVLACLIEAMAQAGHTLAWATLDASGETSAQSLSRLQAAGAADLGAFDDLFAPPSPPDSRLARWIGYAKALAGIGADDDPAALNPIDPAAATARLMAFRPDAVFLFWDTKFERLLPYLGDLRAIGYLARPPYAARLSRLDEMTPKDWRWRLTRRLVEAAQSRHFARMGKLLAAANICALDAREYTRHAVASRYVPNTWPDVFGDAWRAKRAAAQDARPGIEILGNIGGLDATGNRYGLRYIADEVLPQLERSGLPEPWRINICGRGKLPDALARKLDHPRFTLRGFVPDIDAEMLANRIFLLCNNAGPYTGGYTRVIYAMAAGIPLVAHRRLAESMPELRHDENCLLGADGAEIAAHVARAAADQTLRQRLSEAGRATYARAYAPKVVAASLTEMAA